MGIQNTGRSGLFGDRDPAALLWRFSLYQFVRGNFRIPASWPGYDLTIGSTGEKVRQLQNQLNTISKGYPLIPKIAADGVYGEDTANAVKIFQKVFHLPQTGVVDYPTWYRISDIYVGVSRIAELS